MIVTPFVNRTQYYTIALISAFAIAVRVILIPYLGNGLHGNPVDIYYVNREAAGLVLKFQDPYLYSNYTNHIHEIVTFAYLPMVPLFYAPFLLIGADIRFGNILADVIIVASLYFIAISTSRTTFSESFIFYSGSFAYAILPISVWLSAVAGTNMMIGTMFLLVALALLFEGKQILSGIFLGLGLATNQLIILVFPLIAFYCFRNRNMKPVLASILVSLGTILPFLLYSPSKFLYDVLFFQFDRPLQANGLWSLYSIVYALTGFKIDTYLRLIIFLVPAGISAILFSKSKRKVLIGVTALSALGAFMIPVNGFLNYFLIPSTTICALVPAIFRK